MNHLLLIAHAPLASAFREVAAHAFPDCAEGVDAIDVPPSAGAEQVDALIAERLAAHPGDEVLILTDTFGATPCNAALRQADGTRVRVVAGLSVPMLWRTLCYRHEPLEQLVERAVAGGMQSVMHVAPVPRQNQSQPSGPGAHDQVQHHHQQ